MLGFLPDRGNLCGQEATAPHLSPTTLTTDDQRRILRASARTFRDQTIISLALGTGLRLAEIVGLEVGYAFALDGTPRVRVPVSVLIAVVVFVILLRQDVGKGREPIDRREPHARDIVRAQRELGGA
jgi:integrase